MGWEGGRGARASNGFPTPSEQNPLKISVNCISQPLVSTIPSLPHFPLASLAAWERWGGRRHSERWWWESE